MNKDESESVLIALGFSLNWEYYSANALDLMIAHTTYGYYGVSAKGDWFSREYWKNKDFSYVSSVGTQILRWYLRKHGAFYVRNFADPGEHTMVWSPHKYKTQADAKAACQRHYILLMEGKDKWD